MSYPGNAQERLHVVCEQLGAAPIRDVLKGQLESLEH